MQAALADVITKRKDRAIAIVLGIKERECDPQLSPQARAKLRKVILDQFNELTELVMDVMRSLDTGEVSLNEIYLEKIDEIHDSLVGSANRR